jgi:hypothetical protein
VHAGIKEAKTDTFTILTYSPFIVILMYRPMVYKLWRSNTIICPIAFTYQSGVRIFPPQFHKNPALFLIFHGVALYEIFLPNSGIDYILSFGGIWPTQSNFLNLLINRLNGCHKILSNRSLWLFSGRKRK